MAERPSVRYGSSLLVYRNLCIHGGHLVDHCEQEAWQAVGLATPKKQLMIFILEG